MRLLGTIIAIVAVLFLGAMGYYWLREGSLESAGRELDKDLATIDQKTEPLQNSLGQLGDGLKETDDRAKDGDDRT